MVLGFPRNERAGLRPQRLPIWKASTGQNQCADDLLFPVKENYYFLYTAFQTHLALKYTPSPFQASKPHKTSGTRNAPGPGRQQATRKGPRPPARRSSPRGVLAGGEASPAAEAALAAKSGGAGGTPGDLRGEEEEGGRAGRCLARPAERGSPPLPAARPRQASQRPP